MSRRSRRQACWAIPVAIVVLGIAAVCARLWPGSAVAVAVLVCYVPTLFLGFLGYVAVRGRVQARRPVDFVVILGSRLVDERISPVQAGRLERGLALARSPTSGGPVLVLSGGRPGGARRSEAAAMADELRSRGVPADAVLIEDRSRDTAENLAFSHAAMARRRPGYRCAVVTSTVHVLRAAIVARRVGIRGRVFGAPVAWRDWPAAAMREFALLLAEYRWPVALVAMLLVFAGVATGASAG